MQTTTVSMRLSEWEHGGLDRVRDILHAATREQDPEVLVSIQLSEDNIFFGALDKSIQQSANGEVHVFTMSELESLINSWQA